MMLLRRVGRTIRSWKSRLSELAQRSRSPSEALEELDALLSLDPWAAFQNRMGVMAPLVGVTATALGFLLFEQAEYEQIRVESVGTIMNFLSPLFYGVLMGAVLAIINQILSQLARTRMVTARSDAASYLGQIKQNAGEPEQQVDAVLSRFSSQVESLGQSLATAVARASEQAEKRAGKIDDQIEALAGHVSRMVKACQDGTTRLESSLRGTTTQTDAAAGVVQALEVSVDRIQSATSSLTESSIALGEAASHTKEAWQSAMQERFSPSLAEMAEALERSHAQIERFERAVASVPERLEILEASLARLHRVMELLGIGGNRRRSVRAVDPEMSTAEYGQMRRSQKAEE
jgi:hypothetical protein